MRDIFEALTQDAHTFQRCDVIALGLKDRDLYRALAERELHRVRPGTYALYDDWHAATDRQRHLWRARAVVRTAGAEVALATVTALVAMGSPVWGLPLDDVHLLRTDGRAGRKEAGVNQHCGRTLAGDVVVLDGTLVTSAARTCVDLAAMKAVSIESLLVVFDHVLRHHLVDKAGLYSRSERSRHVPGSLRTDLVIGLADGRRETVGESRTAYACWCARLPTPTPQLELTDAAGHVWARLDFAWPQLGVWLEFDGKEKYLMDRRPGESRESAILRAKRAERDRERAIARATGWRCVRVTWSDLERPQSLIRRLRAEVLGAA